MNYLSPSEYGQFGLETATSESWIAAASALVNAHCRRATLSAAEHVERMRVTSGRNTARLTCLPLVAVAPATSAITSARGRYASPRQGDGAALEPLAFDVARTFALPGAWIQLDPAGFEYFAETGEVTLPAHALGLTYNEVEIAYTAGLTTIPDEVKFACAQIVKNAQATPALNVRSGQVDQLKMEYFGDSLVDSSVRKLLAPYVAQRMG